MARHIEAVLLRRSVSNYSVACSRNHTALIPSAPMRAAPAAALSSVILTLGAPCIGDTCSMLLQECRCDGDCGDGGEGFGQGCARRWGRGRSSSTPTYIWGAPPPPRTCEALLHPHVHVRRSSPPHANVGAAAAQAYFGGDVGMLHGHGASDVAGAKGCYYRKAPMGGSLHLPAHRCTWNRSIRFSISPAQPSFRNSEPG